MAPPELPYFPRPDLVDVIKRIYFSGLTDAVTMFAARRMGKTEFVKRDLMPAAEAWGWDCHYVDLWIRRDEPELALVEALEEQARQLQRATGLLRRPNRVKARADASVLGIEAEWTSAAAVVDSNLFARMRVALKALVGKGDRAVLLVIDEFQTLADGKYDDFVAALRATMLELRPSLKLFFTGSSRAALNSMFRSRRAPLFESAMPVPLPILDRAFSEDRAAVYTQMSSRQTDADVLDAVFEQVGRIPKYLNSILIHMVASLSSDPWAGYESWLQSEGRDRLSDLWASLKPIDRHILAHLAMGGAALFSAQFIARAEEATQTALTPAKVQTAVKRLVRADVLAPTGVEGEYELEDRAFMLYVRQLLTGSSRG